MKRGRQHPPSPASLANANIALAFPGRAGLALAAPVGAAGVGRRAPDDPRGRLERIQGVQPKSLMPRPRSLILPIVAALVVAVVAYGTAAHGVGSTTQAKTVVASSRSVHLRIANYSFRPATLRVKVGTTVTVTNTDSTAHTATARSGAFDTGTLATGASARFTLKKPGTYTYYCQFHAFMNGTIVVVR
jgi:plastocyanin